MKKILILPVFSLVFLFFTPVLAQGNSQSNTHSTIMENPGVLPTNPFYFLKEWRRGIKQFFTFDPVAKLELELGVVNEKAAEALKVQEALPDDAVSVTRAIENYKDSQARLKSRVESLQKTSENPNIDRLLDQLTERAAEHESLFNDLAAKFDDQSGVKAAVEEAKEKIEEVVGIVAGKDDPEKFAARLEKYDYSVETVDQIFNNAPEETKEALSQVRDEFADRLNEELGQTLKALSLKISEYDKLFVAQKFTKISRPKFYELLENAKYHLRLANGVFSKNDFAGTQLHIGHIRGFLEDLSNLIASVDNLDSGTEFIQPESLCGKIQCLRYDPVCGEDGKTYSCGEADTKACGVDIAYKGECSKAPSY